LFISDTDAKEKKRGLKRTIEVYMILAFTAVLTDNIYALFGHGVRSASMTWMFLYPLLGGALVYLLIELLLPRIRETAGLRLSYNLYNSGIALLTVGSFLRGILEIAGTASPYTPVFCLTGWGFAAAGLIRFLPDLLRYRIKSKE
jgi:hypothetical protein